MDSNRKVAKSKPQSKPLVSCLKTKNVVGKILCKEKDDDESKRLLSPRNRKGEVSKSDSKTKRKVQWKDTNGGNKIAEIMKFQPSDASDSEDDDDSDFCFCTIM